MLGTARALAGELFLPFLTSALTPLVWGLAYLTFTMSQQYVALIAMFSFTLYAALQAAYQKYYHAQAVSALEAIRIAQDHYHLSLADPTEFLEGMDAVTRALAARDLRIVVVDRATPEGPPFLNYRAYLQPRGTGRSIAMISRQTAGQRFFLLHELGHLTRVSHYNGLYDSYALLRLIVTYGPFLCLVPTWWMALLVLAAWFTDWFLRGALRREYIADSFAWSALARAGEDVRRHARRVATVFRHAKREDDLAGIELANRERLCQMILTSVPDAAAANAWVRGDRWLKEDAVTRLGTGMYANVVGLIQVLLTALGVWQFDGDAKRIAIFLVVAVWGATGLRLWQNRQALPVYQRLAFAVAIIPRSSQST